MTTTKLIDNRPSPIIGDARPTPLMSLQYALRALKEGEPNEIALLQQSGLLPEDFEALDTETRTLLHDNFCSKFAISLMDSPSPIKAFFTGHKTEIWQICERYFEVFHICNAMAERLHIPHSALSDAIMRLHGENVQSSDPAKDAIADAIMAFRAAYTSQVTREALEWLRSNEGCTTPDFNDIEAMRALGSAVKAAMFSSRSVFPYVSASIFPQVSGSHAHIFGETAIEKIENAPEYYAELCKQKLAQASEYLTAANTAHEGKVLESTRKETHV